MNSTPTDMIVSPDDAAAQQGFWSTPHALRLRVFGILLILDLLSIGIGFAVPCIWYRYDPSLVGVFFVASAVYVAIAFNGGAFSFKPSRTFMIDTGPAVRSLLFTYGTLFLMSYFLRLDQTLPRGLLVIAMATGLILLSVLRQIVVVYTATHLRDRLLTQLLIVDGMPITPPDGFQVFDARARGLRPNLRDPAMLNAFGLLIRGCERVAIACRPEDRNNWAMMLKGVNVRGEIVVNDLESYGAFGVSNVGDLPALTVAVGPLPLRKALAKRLFDLAICVPALIALLPGIILIAIAIKLDSKGPVLFRQRRVGQGNEFFYILKFRSMKVEQSDPDGKKSASRDDDRITRVGYFIRRTSIDELPQLFNVLLGDMSIVGPRPHALGSLAGDKLFWDIDERYWHRHALKPGITGLAQVRGFRGATTETTDLTQRLQADLEYISKWSFWRDAAILVLTVRVLVHRNTF
ncbi:sugar transferase [Sphingomonas hankookensis]|uniref:sugar transferase n=1 Tax=Sphingomonas hankookensis TaxID=563996 RepID=UPI00234EE511|nr:sugar transferase [Sphingomonas hankookensis]WCP71952.1 sugar transferase [Sphingomonas hankookensis]